MVGRLFVIASCCNFLNRLQEKTGKDFKTASTNNREKKMLKWQDRSKTTYNRSFGSSGVAEIIVANILISKRDDGEHFDSK